MHNGTDNMKDGVLRAIRDEGVAMRPKWHFVLQGALLVTGILILLAGAVAVASFVLFSMRETGALSAPFFGMRGVMPFLRAVPAALVTLSLVFVALLETLVRRYSFAYRAPLLYSLAVLLGLIAVASAATAPLHAVPFRAASRGTPSATGRLYRRLGPRHAKNLRHGTVEKAVGGGFVLRDIEDATSFVLLESGMPPIAIGETVTVLGDENGHAMRARKIRRGRF